MQESSDKQTEERSSQIEPKDFSLVDLFRLNDDS